MKAFTKNIGKLNQFVGERLSNISKHEFSEEFKLLEQQTETRKDGTESILICCNKLSKTLEKTKEDDYGHKRLPVEHLGASMIAYGSALSNDSVYAQALVKLGETEEKIGKIQTDFACNIRENFAHDLEKFMHDVKTFKFIRGKLENRRLDFDAKSNRLQKSKKECPELDEELRIAQQKYEETLNQAEEMMLSLNNREDNQLIALLQFLDHQYNFHSKSAELLAQVKELISDPGFIRDRSKLVRANYSFLAESGNELSINKGDLINVIDEADSGWWVGEKQDGKVGLFPSK